MPIAKKRGARKVEDHRGVTLMPSAYKICNDISGKAEKRNRRKRDDTGGAGGV